MASQKQTKVVSIVRHNGEAPVLHKPKRPVPKKVNAPLKAAAKKSRAKARQALPKKARAKSLPAPVIVREEPHILKRDEGKPLVERLNPKLLEQLRTRKVTNAVAAEALGVHETYLCRVLSELGEEKVKGSTSAHREARAKLTKARNDTRILLAKKVNRLEMTIERAAKEANCSVRTMFRYCAKYANLRK